MIVQESYEKTLFLVPHSSILHEIESHIIPITWENWILIERETYGKTQTFQRNRFLPYFMWGINPYNSQNMGKVNSHSKENLWENTNIFKGKGFLNFLLVVKIHAVPKIWEKWIYIVWKKHGKTQTFQIYGFLKYFGWSRNPYNSQNMGKVNSHNMEKVWEKNRHSRVMDFSNILGEAEIHTIPKVWEKWILIVREIYGKTQIFQS